MTTSNKKARQLRDAIQALMVAHGTLDARRPCGKLIPLSSAYALLELSRTPEPITVSELATKLAIDRTNVSRLCTRMEEAGELVRGSHPEDGRVRTLRLTAHGKTLARSVDQSSTRHFARLAQSLGDSTAQIIDSLKQLEQAMTSSEDNK